MAKVVSQRTFSRPGQVLLMIDTLMIGFSGIVFQNIELALYAGVGIFVTARTVDMVLTGTPFAEDPTALTIVSDASEIIGHNI